MTEITRRALPALAALALPTVARAQAAAPAPAAAKLTLMLDWFVNPDHAPIIIAQEGGHFARAGLEVRVVAPADPNDPPRLVAAKQADLGVYYQKNLYLAVDQGLPLARVGTLVATPLSTLTVLQDGPIQKLADLKGKKIGFSTAGFEEVAADTILGSVGLSSKDVTLVNVNFGLSSALMSRQVDAILGGFRNFELHQLALEGRPGRAFYPEQHGMPIYDELIYVAHKDRVKDATLRRFMDAVESATTFLINNREESWKMFIAGPRKELDNELNRRAFADTADRFSLSPAALDRNRYDRFARFLHGRKMIGSVPPVDSYAVELPPA
ncbi:ABC transporter ATP-binding protein [Pseudoroseomonas wenyumeiae]|uniref:ABC transporter ATP-binding protein n=1 Tax=Teichococcus wenyumeiae TaxID=2478470 RepID=A0A3A9K3Z9_9PROT|nr:ABC transporter substrate-binding protein [Pseudoroseomonas wenyumeiae]RKK06079.1 ABC transporter ATP-binding protein [Pseudoroseomonas wenyumeiae]RMI25568.1 ABC transporter ATP-binding protein [Pseudoroseomonas wenyumeiae]